MDAARKKRQTGLICLGLTLAVLAAYWQVGGHDFVNFDDHDYVTTNPHVQPGLTWPGVWWALTTLYAANWHPLTWISHMLDVQLYGMNPAGHHWTNVVLHLANSILLFLLLQYMSKTTWPSAMVAALFALHPLHVESVAWVSERKDVLSALFWILSIWAYARHAEKSSQGKGYFLLSIVLFAMGLMAKPMLVTLPFVLLLLDYWPLRRGQVPISRLLVEKTPFFTLAALSCLVTYIAQSRGGSVTSITSLPFDERLAAMPVAYVRYLAKFFWPAHLVIPYPLFTWHGWIVAGSILILVAFSALVVWQARTRPFLIIGWLWFLGTLVPVIGLVQVGVQSMADRYTYIPSIGLFIVVVWAAGELASRLGVAIPAIMGVAAIGACLLLTTRQVSFWKNTGTLFQHSIQNSAGNFWAYTILGAEEAVQGQTNAALDHLETAVQINPSFAMARNKLGSVYLGLGRTDEAVAQFQEAVRCDPKMAAAHYNLGYALLARGQPGEALDQFQAQVNLEPDVFLAQNNMGSVLLQNNLPSDAIPFLQRAIEINPTNADARYNLGNALFRTGKVADAVSQYEKSLQLNPNHIQARNDLAWILACQPDRALRNGPRAVELASRGDELSGGQNPVIVGTLAASYAEAGKFPDAIATEKRAVKIAQAQTNNALADSLEKRLKFYEAGSPWRDSPSK